MEAVRDLPQDDGARRFIEQFALLLTDGGIPRMAARVFACVLADDAAQLTASELAERLQVSPAAISGAARYLIQVDLLMKCREPGARRDHYRLADDGWYEAFGHKEVLLRRWEDGLLEGVELLGADSPAGRRMEETRAFFAFLRSELGPMLERWREHQRAAGIGRPVDGG
ncbi:MAG: GbsR/MarR family transcriptional regulator [Solirubrobacteraceae bacterium]